MSLYEIAVPKFSRSLKAMKQVLGKAKDHAEEKGIDPEILLNARLYPDMFPLKRQIQIATDAARRGCGKLTGVDVPEFPDSEVSFAELIDRVDAAIDFVSTLTPDQFGDAENLEIELSLSSGNITLDGTGYLMGFAMANFSFHYITAYNILRHNGVVLKKMDYLGSP